MCERLNFSVIQICVLRDYRISGRRMQRPKWDSSEPIGIRPKHMKITHFVASSLTISTTHPGDIFVSQYARAIAHIGYPW
jgi:hypothetical protein